MTLNEWAALDEDVEGELIDGVLEEKEMPTVVHEVIVLWLGAVLRSWARRHRGLATGHARDAAALIAAVRAR